MPNTYWSVTQWNGMENINKQIPTFSMGTQCKITILNYKMHSQPIQDKERTKNKKYILNKITQ